MSSQNFGEFLTHFEQYLPQFLEWTQFLKWTHEQLKKKKNGFFTSCHQFSAAIQKTERIRRNAFFLHFLIFKLN